MKLFGISTGWILAASVAASFLSGVYVTRLYYLVDISEDKLVDAKQEAKVAKDTLMASEKAIQKQNATETGYLAKLKEAQHETARIGTLLANQSLRLRVTGVSEACTDSSPLAAGAAETSEQLRRAYSALRSDIDIVQHNLELCIATLRNDRGL